MKKKSEKDLSGSHLKGLKKDFEKNEKAKDYLEVEMKKLKREEERVRKKMEKEKEEEILRLKKRINFLQRRKKK